MGKITEVMFGKTAALMVVLKLPEIFYSVKLTTLLEVNVLLGVLWLEVEVLLEVVLLEAVVLEVEV